MVKVRVRGFGSRYGNDVQFFCTVTVEEKGAGWKQINKKIN